jgi:hypothetical protein
VSAPTVDTLLEAAATPYRERDPEGRILPAPAWWDLSPEARETLFELQASARALERAQHPLGWSGTVAAVMERIRSR